MENKKLDLQNMLYQQFARIGKAISSPKRLELLDILCQGERTVEVLAKETKMTMGNTSQHLQVLRESRLIESEKQGMFVMYRLSDSTVITFMNAIRTLAENRLLEVEQIKQQFFEQKDGFEAINHSELVHRILDGSVLLIDVRPHEEYQISHIEGAISIPLVELENHISKLEKNKDIVAYCRGKYCVASIQAVEKLKENGFNAMRLEDSVQDWQTKKLPIYFDNKKDFFL